MRSTRLLSDLALRLQDPHAEPVRVLMVCMGNICRSPTAQAVLEKMVRDAGWAERIEVDSAGTHGWHIDSPPDERAQQHAQRRGYDLSPQRARQLQRCDFDAFDLVLVMDEANERDVLARCPRQHRDKVRRLAVFGSQPQVLEVPDPYFGGADGFEHVLDLVEDACAGVLARLQQGADSKMPPAGGMEG